MPEKKRLERKRFRTIFLLFIYFLPCFLLNLHPPSSPGYKRALKYFFPFLLVWSCFSDLHASPTVTGFENVKSKCFPSSFSFCSLDVHPPRSPGYEKLFLMGFFLLVWFCSSGVHASSTFTHRVRKDEIKTFPFSCSFRSCSS